MYYTKSDTPSTMKHTHHHATMCLFLLGGGLLLGCGLLLLGCGLLLRGSLLLGGGLLLGCGLLLLRRSLLLGGLLLLGGSLLLLRSSLLLGLGGGRQLLLVLGRELVRALDLDKITGSDHVLENLQEGAVGPGLAGVGRLDVVLDGREGGTVTVLELRDGRDDTCFIHGWKWVR